MKHRANPQVNEGRIAEAVANDDFIVFPNFYVYRSDGYWRWVSRDATKSSVAGFESCPQCALDAERTLTAIARSRST